MNTITLSGNLTREVALRYTPDGRAVATIAIAQTARVGPRPAGSTGRPSRLNELAENPDQPSAQIVVDPRKSGMPESVEIPAPVSTATAVIPRAHAGT
jgi:hypothetical protein